MEHKRPSITFFHNNNIKRRRRYLWFYFFREYPNKGLITKAQRTAWRPKIRQGLRQLKLQEIHLKSSVKPMVIIGVCILIIINKLVMISRSCRQRTDDWRWPLGLLAVTSGYTHAARSIPTQTQPSRTHWNTYTLKHVHKHAPKKIR